MMHMHRLKEKYLKIEREVYSKDFIIIKKGEIVDSWIDFDDNKSI